FRHRSWIGAALALHRAPPDARVPRSPASPPAVLEKPPTSRHWSEPEPSDRAVPSSAIVEPLRAVVRGGQCIHVYHASSGATVCCEAERSDAERQGRLRG